MSRSALADRKCSRWTIRAAAIEAARQECGVAAADRQREKLRDANAAAHRQSEHRGLEDLHIDRIAGGGELGQPKRVVVRERRFRACAAEAAATLQQAKQRRRYLHVVLQPSRCLGQLPEVIVRQLRRYRHFRCFRKHHGADAILVGQQQQFPVAGYPAAQFQRDDEPSPGIG
jgi:hypothetical protein